MGAVLWVGPEILALLTRGHHISQFLVYSKESAVRGLAKACILLQGVLVLIDQVV